MRKKIEIPKEKREEIIKHFLTHHDNRTTVMASLFELPASTISHIIDKELMKCQNYMGS